MRTVLCALNARFHHINLAVRYLQKVCPAGTTIVERSIHDPYDVMLKDLLFEQGTVYVFSCYIWNIELVTALAADIKSVLPYAAVFLGGPEVSYDTQRFFDGSGTIDGVIRGEGEQVLPQLLNSIEKQ